MAELQDIFAQYGETYRLNHSLLSNQLKTMRAIENFRTSALGGHLDACDKCGFIHISYNSCRNRHCAKCQTLSKERWIDAKKDDLLNVGYFYIVFTIPDTLNSITYFRDNGTFDDLISSLYQKEWIVYCKPPALRMPGMFLNVSAVILIVLLYPITIY